MNLTDVVDALDHDEIMARGGANCGQEEFELVKCPHCAWIYLIECEAFTIYLNADDLEDRDSVDTLAYECIKCHGKFPEAAWSGPKAPVDLSVTWAELSKSPWHWIAPLEIHSQIEWPPRTARSAPTGKNVQANCEMQILGGHGISFPGYLHESILESALTQKRLTGAYPAVDDAFAKSLKDAFQSATIYGDVQGLLKKIENWRNTSFTVDDPVKVSRLKQTEELPDMNFAPQQNEAVESMLAYVKGMLLAGAKQAPVEIIGPLDPLYVWCLNVAVRLMKLDVPAETFQMFISGYIQNLYGSNSLEIVKLAVDTIKMLPPDCDGAFLAFDFALLAKLFEEMCCTGATVRFGPNAVAVFTEWKHSVYKIALGRVLTSENKALITEIFALYHGKEVFPDTVDKLENARYHASNLGCCGRFEEADRYYDECLKLSQMPKFAKQANAIWATKFYANRAETEIERGDIAKAKSYLKHAAEAVSQLEPLVQAKDKGAAEAICIYAVPLLRVGDYEEAERNFSVAKKIFLGSMSPFWIDHCTMCLAEIARTRGKLSEFKAELTGVRQRLEAMLHPSEPYWQFGNLYFARFAVDGGKIDEAKRLYESCCDLACRVLGPADSTRKMLDEYVGFLKEHHFDDEARKVQERAENLVVSTA